MRYAFIITIIVLLQLFSFGAACSLEWWLQPWSTPLLIQNTWIAVFAATNALLLLSVTKSFANSYRWISAWMMVMHFILLTALLSSLVYGGFWLLHALDRKSTRLNSSHVKISYAVFC